MNVTNLSEALRRWREEAGISVRQAADVVGIHYTTLSRLENGHGRLDAENLVKVVAWLMKPLSKGKPCECQLIDDQPVTCKKHTPPHLRSLVKARTSDRKGQV